MIKITDLTEKRFRTTHNKDALGNRIRGREEYVAKRQVRTVKSGPRFGHFIVDLLCFEVFAYLINYLLELIEYAVGPNNPIGLTVGLIASLALLLMFPVLYFFCELLWQKTPGKMLTKTIVINEYGNKPDISSLIFRSLIRIVPFEPFSCLGDYSYGWHDRWSNTFVVSEEELKKLKQLQVEQNKVGNK